MDSLLQAKRRFTDARKAADATYLVLQDCYHANSLARSEYERAQAQQALTNALAAHEKATTKAKEARRIFTDLRAGLTVTGGRG